METTHETAVIDFTTIRRNEVLRVHDIPNKYALGAKGFDKTHNAEAYEAVKSWVRNPEPVRLYLYGGAGTGKSHLLWSALIELSMKGQYAKRTTSSDFVAAYNSASWGDREAIVNRLKDVKYLILDEWGVEPLFKNEENDAAQSALYRIFDYRYERDKKILGAGNMAISELAARSDLWKRVQSRFSENGGTIKMQGGDMRPKILGDTLSAAEAARKQHEK